MDISLDTDGNQIQKLHHPICHFTAYTTALWLHACYVIATVDKFNQLATTPKAMMKLANLQGYNSRQIGQFDMEAISTTRVSVTSV